jgi:hypothetical protein
MGSRISQEFCGIRQKPALVPVDYWGNSVNDG